MKSIIPILLIFFSFSSVAFGQVKHKLVINYWDFNKSNVMSRGFYFVDEFTGETTLEHGKWNYWNKNGKLTEVRNYKKGVLHGEVSLYYTNGNKKEEGYFVDGEQDSVYKAWHENGNLKTEGYYIDTEPSGKWISYYENGFHHSEEKIENGKTYMLNFWIYDSTQTLKNGNGEVVWFYKSNGNVNELYTYKDGLKNGPFVEYSVYGKELVKGAYLKGQKNGEWVFTYYDGKPDTKMTYKYDKLNGPYIKLYDN